MKKFIYTVIIIGLVALTFSLYIMLTAYQSDMGASESTSSMNEEQHSKRIVLISQEQGSYMMNEVKKGASQKAADYKMMIDFWGIYGKNPDEVLKQIDIAIASKVDGIIVEGMDHPEFERMVKKATAKGIPVITINADSPGSLRKTYVGSNHYQEGITMGEHIAKMLNGQGVIGVIRNIDSPDMDQLRLKGLTEVFSKYEGIKLVFSSDNQDMVQPKLQAYDILNHYPGVGAIIGLPVDSGESIVQAGYTRSNVIDYKVFLFDDSPQTVKLINKGQIQAGLSQNYEEMGGMSVELMNLWLEGSRIPLNNTYFTPIRVVTSLGGNVQ